MILTISHRLTFQLLQKINKTLKEQKIDKKIIAFTENKKFKLQLSTLNNIYFS